MKTKVMFLHIESYGNNYLIPIENLKRVEACGEFLHIDINGKWGIDTIVLHNSMDYFIKGISSGEMVFKPIDKEDEVKEDDESKN